MGGRKQEVERLRESLAAAQRRIATLEGELRESRSTDSLTGLPSVDALDRRLGQEVERSRRHGQPLAVAVADIDGFRAISARHGRETGRRVVAAVGRLFAERIRATDAVSRSGTDEFVVMLPETTAPEALQAFDRYFLELEKLRVGDVDGVAVSVGIAQWERGVSAEQLIATAASRVEGARALGGGRAVASDGPDAAGGVDASTRGDVVAALTEALLERDRYTGEHSESVVDLVETVARGLALDAAEVDHVKAAALLHDIGKVAIPDHLLNKPGPLDEREWKVMREHPVIGERILRAIPGMGPIARIVRHEHERFDGSGYPDGVAADAIPIGARIILACDAYHAMTSDRPYRKAMSHADAVAELAEHAGTQFDPSVTEVLIGSLYGRRQSGGGRTDDEAAVLAGPRSR